MGLGNTYKIIKTNTQLEALIKNCIDTGYASIDFETTGLKYQDQNEYPLILGVSFQPGFSYIIPLGHSESHWKHKYEKILRKFGKAVIENPAVTKVAWNLKFEYKWLLRYGIFPKGRLFDAMLAKYCLDEERPHGLKPFVETFFPKYTGYENDIKARGGEGEALEVDWKKTPYLPLCKYCGHDTDLTLRAMIFMEPKLIKSGFYSLFRNLLMGICRVLAESEYRGTLIDRKYLEGLISQYKTKLNESDAKLRATPSLLKYESLTRIEHTQALIKKVKLEIKEIKRGDSKQKTRMITHRREKIKRYIAGQFTDKEKYDGLNFNSPQQIVKFLYTSPNGLKLTPPFYTKDKKTKKETENPSTSEEALLKLQKRDKTKFIDNLLKNRELVKLDSTYISGMYKHLGEDDRVHANFKINGTVTGRLSCFGGSTEISTDTGNITIKDLCSQSKVTVHKNSTTKVLTHDGTYQRVLFGLNQGEMEVVEVELENGLKVICTVDHKFLTPNGWMELQEIYNTNGSILTKS